MRVTLLKNNPSVYSCNVYLIRGEWNKLDDINTLIDAGTDGFILDEIQNISTGFGKRRIEQVILTHEHFDHSGGLKILKKEFEPAVYAFKKNKFVDHTVEDGMEIKAGDATATILHTPGHSHDSICIYFEEGNILFSGDTPLNIRTPGGTYTYKFTKVLERLISLNIKTIYPGHDYPITKNVKDMLEFTLKNVNKSNIVF